MTGRPRQRGCVTVSVDRLMEGFDRVNRRSNKRAGGAVRARFSSERSQSVQKDERFAAEVTVGDAQVEAEYFEVPGYNDKAYEELVAAMETMNLRDDGKLLVMPHIANSRSYGRMAQLQVPIFARPRDILNPFALEKEIPLKESLEAHAIRLAKKKGVKGKAILCGVGAVHIPRSDGVPVSVATVSP
ncbi:hypothetical protein Tco_0535994 [Tanacetum coccineum]